MIDASVRRDRLRRLIAADCGCECDVGFGGKGKVGKPVVGLRCHIVLDAEDVAKIVKGQLGLAVSLHDIDLSYIQGRLFARVDHGCDWYDRTGEQDCGRKELIARTDVSQLEDAAAVIGAHRSDRFVRVDPIAGVLGILKVQRQRIHRARCAIQDAPIRQIDMRTLNQVPVLAEGDG